MGRAGRKRKRMRSERIRLGILRRSLLCGENFSLLSLSQKYKLIVNDTSPSEKAIFESGYDRNARSA
jgi:hypothetical protein